MTYADWRDRFLEGVDQELFPAFWLDSLVEEGAAIFWGNDEAAILAVIKTYPSGVREVHGLVAAGGIEAIKALIPQAEEWGASVGATRASISSHPAWARIMRDAGYLPEQLTIAKDLRSWA